MEITRDRAAPSCKSFPDVVSVRPLRSYRLPVQVDPEQCAPFDKLQIAWSDDLQLALAMPLPSSDDLANFYSTRYRFFMGKARSFESYIYSPNYRAQVRSQVDWISPKLQDNSALLDVGAGFGLFLWQLRQVRPDCRLSAFEPDPDAQPHLQRLATVANDFDNFWGGTAFPLESFDAIILSHVLEHLLDPVVALGVLRDYVKPGGHILIEVPNEPLEILEDSRRSSDLPHLWFFSEPGLVRMCEVAGLEVSRSAILGIRRQRSKAALPVRIHRRLMRALRGAWWSEPGWYAEAHDRTDLRVLCRVP